jgi:hypothetical protein
VTPTKRLRLYLDHTEPSVVFRFIRPDGSRDQILGLRLVTFANLFRQLLPVAASADYGITQCIVDTGSYLSVIPQRIWQLFRPGVVTPLAFDPSTSALQRRLTVGGGTFPFELGEATLRLEDQRQRYMMVTAVVQLLLDGGSFPLPMTIGLRGGVIDGRTLTAQPDPVAPFGQGWHLEEP